jgi:hypothetical protein
MVPSISPTLRRLAWCGLAWLIASPLPAQTSYYTTRRTVVSDAPVAPFNVHLVVTEEFLNRFVAREQVEPGPVEEQVQEVAVRGERVSNTRLSLDLVPCLDKAHAQIVLDGDVQSRTAGFSEQAVVHTIGNQQFRATKDLFFDGETVSTRHATISVNSQMHNVGIQTKLDHTPLGPVVNRVAMKIADQRRPQSEELSRQRLTERVYPKFDGEVDQKLAEANALLETRLRATLKKYDLWPTASRVTTTDRHLHYAVAYAGDVALAAPSPPRVDLAAVHAVNYYVHESAINALFDRLKLKGLKTTDRDLRGMLSRLRSLRDPASPEGPAGALGMMNFETHIEFDSERPISVELNNEQLTLRIRAQIRPMGQALLPPLELAVPIRLVERGSQWQLIVSDLDVRPLDEPSGPDRPTDAGIKVIRDALADVAKEFTFPRELDLPSYPQDKPKLQLTRVRAVDGWLAVSLD